MPFTNWINLGIIFCIYISEYFKIFEIKKSRSLGKHSFFPDLWCNSGLSEFDLFFRLFVWGSRRCSAEYVPFYGK